MRFSFYYKPFITLIEKKSCQLVMYLLIDFFVSSIAITHLWRRAAVTSLPRGAMMARGRGKIRPPITDWLWTLGRPCWTRSGASMWARVVAGLAARSGSARRSCRRARRWTWIRAAARICWDLWRITRRRVCCPRAPSSGSISTASGCGSSGPTPTSRIVAFSFDGGGGGVRFGCRSLGLLKIVGCTKGRRVCFFFLIMRFKWNIRHLTSVWVHFLFVFF